MPRKIILTQSFDIVFPDKLIGIKVIDGDTYYNRENGTFGDDGVIVATDINGNEIFLGEYRDYFKARDMVEDISDWLANNIDLNPFDIICDDEDFDDVVKCQRSYISQSTPDTPYSKYFREFMKENFKKQKEAEKNEHPI
ncbi:MAG: hypothetical protein IJ555_10200 [Ruminococcus sp.]|uniref:hypothetical protein n=1 Tax=Ruminococcus sp. TaxID=41978 RepID=UPI002600D91B|nr:hypothetical protein [Ruminococcus sp.]MBR1384158.1 hypothetical protein [Ruminococcus sp.]MBR1431765.1 hypothetical protein [Ruminococcus sp.]